MSDTLNKEEASKLQDANLKATKEKIKEANAVTESDPLTDKITALQNEMNLLSEDPKNTEKVLKIKEERNKLLAEANSLS
jgi:small-conductance mechanosensitive channel